MRQTMQPPAADIAALNPAYRYLRATTGGRNVALLVLGYVDATPHANTEVWYSGNKETVRLFNGRLAGTAGLAANWSSVRFGEMPGWRSTMTARASYRRQRDAMPGYLISVSERVQVSAIDAPQSSALVGLDPQELQWFEERTVSEGQVPALPPSRFAVDLSDKAERVVYSEQCLSVDLCLTFQAWPVRAAAAHS